jgi:hypothetical protein
VIATDADSGMNAKIKYRIQKGGFEDFSVDEETGVVAIANRLDFDRRSTYNMEVIAVDGGMGLLCYVFFAQACSIIGIRSSREIFVIFSNSNQVNYKMF